MKLILSLCILSLLCCTISYASPGSPGNDTLPSNQTANLFKFDPEAATQKYLDLLPAKSKERSDAYFEGKYWLLLWNILYDALVTWIILSTGLSSRMKKIAFRSRNVKIQNLLYAFLYIIISFLLFFPFSVYQLFIREHQYHLSNQTFLQWLGDDLILLALNAFFGSILLMVLYMAIRKAKTSWWVWGAGIVIFSLIMLMLVSPVFVSPLFNKYTPLTDQSVKAQILSMARANQVPADNVYQFDASRQTSRISANVSGFAGTTRISLNDNLLKRCTPAEIRSVMGHELGHYVLNHVYKGLIEYGVIIFIGFAFLHWSFNRLLRKYGAGWRIRSIADIGGLPLLMFLFSFYLFLATPFTNTITRTAEVEADMFGLNAAREPDGFAAIAMKLSEYRKINPGYWEEILFFDHPSGRNRVLSAMKWKAENLADSTSTRR